MNKAIVARDIDAGDHRLRIYESGARDATPVLFLHGSGPGVTAMANWRGLMTDLAPNYHCVAPDILGFGESECPDPFPRGFTAALDVRAHNTVALLDALALEPAHVVGNSMGGIIALRVAQLAPSRLGKMVLMGAAAEGGLSAEATERAKAFGANPTVNTIGKLLRMFVYDEATFGVDLDELAAERLSVALRPDIMRIGAASAEPIGSPLNFSPEELGQLDHPTLVVHGREDRVLAVERSYYLSRHIPNAQLHIFPRSGHWAHLEQAERFRFLVEAFLGDAL